MVQVGQPALAVELCGIPLKTPLIPAAGTLGKEALEGAESVYGAILPKSVTPNPRTGNPPPRIAEAPAGMVNSIGLQNPGLDRFLEDLDDFDVGLPIFVSVAADTVGGFAAACGRLSADPRVSAIELNLSCPNVEHGGRQFCAGPGAVEEVVGACRAALPGKPLFVKLAVELAVANAVAAEGAGADAVTLVNTVPALIVDARRRYGFETRPYLLRGGLSGPAIKPIALRAVYEASRMLGVPVIGCGGVASGVDVAEFMVAGAAAVQVGSGRFARDAAVILEEFADYLRVEQLEACDLPGLIRRK